MITVHLNHYAIRGRERCLVVARLQFLFGSKSGVILARSLVRAVSSSFQPFRCRVNDMA